MPRTSLLRTIRDSKWAQLDIAQTPQMFAEPDTAPQHWSPVRSPDHRSGARGGSPYQLEQLIDNRRTVTN